MDRGTSMIVTIWVLFGVSAIFLALRVYCRCRGGGRLWWDDWVMIVACVCISFSLSPTKPIDPFLLTSAYRQLFSCIDHAVGTVMIHLGVGKHVAQIDPANLPMLHTLNRVGASFAILACALTKTSWALTMLRIVRSTRDCMRVLVWGLLISVNVLMDVGIILMFLECDDSGLSASPKEMWCWSNLIAANYNVFASGKWLSVYLIASNSYSLPPNLSN